MNETGILVALINITTQIELAMKGDGLAKIYIKDTDWECCLHASSVKMFKVYVDNRDNAYFVVPCGCSSKPRTQVELK